MATFADATNVRQTAGTEFSTIVKPGELVPYSGIYRCTGCTHEAALNHRDPAPPQNSHQHIGKSLLTLNPIRWQLLVKTEQQPSLGSLIALAMEQKQP